MADVEPIIVKDEPDDEEETGDDPAGIITVPTPTPQVEEETEFEGDDPVLLLVSCAKNIFLDFLLFVKTLYARNRSTHPPKE